VVRRSLLVQEVWDLNPEPIKSPTRCHQFATIATLYCVGLGAKTRRDGHRSLVTPEKVLFDFFLIREYLVLILFFYRYQCIFWKIFRKKLFPFLHGFFMCILRIMCTFRIPLCKRPDFTRVFYVFWWKRHK